MKYQKILFLILISFTIEARYTTLRRKLDTENSEIPTEPETVEVDTTIIKPPEPPVHEQQTTTPTQEDSGQTSWNITELDNTIPTVLTENPPHLGYSLFIIIGIGNFFRPPHLPYMNIIFYMKMIIGVGIPPYRIYFTVRITYRRLRGLQEDIEEKEEQAVGIRITYDEDPNIQYNGTINMDENAEIVKATIAPSSFGAEGESEVHFIASSLVNETISKEGIQSAVGDELLKIQYLMNNTVLEENGLKFKLTGEMDSKIKDKEVTLFFDEKGNGIIKNATCQVNHLQSNKFEFDCLAEKPINAHLNGVNGESFPSKEKVFIFMKNGTDEILNAGNNNYIGLYNRVSSSGLSGGAIAGIVIACVVALLAIAIGAMLCRKANTPAPFQESTLGVNTSEVTD